jgi:hypothetical protein
VRVRLFIRFAQGRADAAGNFGESVFLGHNRLLLKRPHMLPITSPNGKTNFR